jgi:capsular exopolysaccharide synthesis family protein
MDHAEFLTPYYPPNKPKPTEEMLVKKLGLNYKTTIRKGTSLIDITAEHPSTQIAEMLVTALIKEFQRQTIEQRKAVTDEGIAALMEESQRLQARLKKSEMELQSFQEHQGSSAFQDSRNNVVIEKLKRLNMEAAQAEADRIKFETTYAQITAAEGNFEKLQNLSVIANDPQFVQIRTAIDELRTAITVLQRRYREKHPDLISLKKRLSETERDLEEKILVICEVARQNLDRARATEKSLQAGLKEQEQASLALNRESIEFKSLARQLQTDQVLYEAVFRRIHEMNVAKGIEPPVIHMVDEPFAPPKAVKPRMLSTFFFSSIIGLIVGLMIAFVRYALDSSIKTKEQAESFFRLPVLGTFPRLDSSVIEENPLLVVHQPQSIASEAFRFLNANLKSLTLGEESAKTLLITSAVPGEGKTFLSSNFACSLAKNGLRTLLIQADHKNPSLHKIFKHIPKAKGFTDYLSGGCDLNDTIVPTGISNLFVMVPGTSVISVSEIGALRQLRTLLDRTMASFDKIIIDSAPINFMSDTLLIAKQVQQTCLVIETFHTPYQMVTDALEKIQHIQAPISGLILNGLPIYSLLGYYNYNAYFPDDKPAKKRFWKRSSPALEPAVSIKPKPSSDYPSLD